MKNEAFATALRSSQYSNMNKLRNDNRRKSLKMMMRLLGAAFFILHSSFFVSCVDNDDDVPQNYYSSTKLTAAQFLEERPEQFSDFIAILKRTPYFSMLSTYGTYSLSLIHI